MEHLNLVKIYTYTATGSTLCFKIKGRCISFYLFSFSNHFYRSMNIPFGFKVTENIKCKEELLGLGITIKI